MMNLLLHVLKAFGIALGWYFLLFAGICVMLSLRFGRHWLVDFGIKDVPEQSFPGFLLVLIPWVLPFFLAFGALYLPPQGRLYAALGALSLILAIWIWVGIQLFNAGRL